ncbi:unknown protein [Seminavis robusta]|uniref:Uncharacterized protein n=1 Tax=Seminavis robusta TaxID=568900 RepID=A0A9N8DZU9_9STRA|nr:unknown protein [Seminavis robusta]|eukprot:Sro485_g152480.1 n/a (132) ;mRNA; f:52262-52657
MARIKSTPVKNREPTVSYINSSFFDKLDPPITRRLHQRVPMTGNKNLTRVDVLREAVKLIQDETEALEALNCRQAVNEIAKMFNLGSAELWYYYSYGEEEAERLFNISSCPAPEMCQPEVETQETHKAEEW